MCEGMLHIRRVVCIKISCAVLILVAFVYCLVSLNKRHRRIGQIFGQTSAPIEHQSFPTFEYSSLYRLRTDRNFEISLNQKLSSLEKTVRGSGLETLLANHTIWQIASPKEKKLWSTWVAQWSNMNPDWVHRVYTSPPKDLLKIFQSIPEVEDAITNFPLIQKDLIRHLLLWYHGGLYANIDTWSRLSLDDCPPIASVIQNNMKIGLMIGVEIDEPFLNHKKMLELGWLRSYGFSQDVLWAPKRFDPILRCAIVRSISHAKTQQQKLGGFTAIVDDRAKRKLLEEISGAAMFTDVVLETLSDKLGDNDELRDPDAGIVRRVSWKKFSRLKNPIWIEAEKHETVTEENSIPGLAILPINVWSNGQEHSHAGSDSDNDACVNQIHRLTIAKNDWRDFSFG